MSHAIHVLTHALAVCKASPIAKGFPVPDFMTALKEFRNIGLQLPRRSGKTSAAKMLHAGTSSLLFSNYLGNRFNYRALEHKYRGRRSEGLRFQHIILDEYAEWPEGLELFIRELAISDMITSDFCVVRLYT